MGNVRMVAKFLLYMAAWTFALGIPGELSRRLEGIAWYYQAAALFGLAVIAVGTSLFLARRGRTQESAWAIIPPLMMGSTWYVTITHRSVWPVWAWPAFLIVTFAMLVGSSPFVNRNSASER